MIRRDPRTSSVAIAILLIATLRLAIPATAATWVPVPNGSVYPVGRSGACAVLDSRRSRVILTNGAYHYFYHSSYVVHLSDTWALDPATLQWAPITPSDSGVVSASEYAAAAYDSLNDRVLMVGGALINELGNVVQLNVGTYSLDAANPTGWRFVATDPGRVGQAAPSLVIDPIRRVLLRFGGGEGAGLPVYNDVWQLPLDGTPQWSQLHPTGAEPPPRWRHGAIYDPVRDRMIIVGGVGLSGEALSDVWAMSLSGTPHWSSIDAGSGPSGPIRTSYDRERDRLIAIGRGSGYTLAAWELDLSQPSAWRLIDLAPGTPTPSAIFDYAAVLDPVSRRMPVLFNDYHEQGYPDLPVPAAIALDLTRLASVQMQASLDSLTFRDGLTRFAWSVTTNRPLHGPVRINRLESAVRTFVADRAPDNFGRIAVSDTTLRPSRHYDYELVWYDGDRYQTLPFPIDTPPTPITLDNHPDSLITRNGTNWITWSVPDDSASFLSPVTLWRKHENEDWVASLTRYPGGGVIRLDDRGSQFGGTVRPDSRYAYRIGWGTGGNQYVSAETSIVTPPVPISRRGWAVPGLVIVEWTYPRSLPRNPWIDLYPGSPVPFASLTPDSFELVRYIGTDAFPVGSKFQLLLGWIEGGATRYQSTQVYVLPTPLYLHDLTLQDAGVQLKFWPQPADTLTELVVERKDDSEWHEVGRAPRPEYEGTFLDTSVEGGKHYDYRLMSVFAGYTIRSAETSFDVPSSYEPPRPEVFAFALGSPGPQPANDFLNLQMTLATSERASVELFDVRGRKLRTEAVHGPGHQQLRLDTSRLTAGIYLVRLTEAGRVARARVVIVR